MREQDGARRRRKYHSGNLIPMFRKAAALRNEMLAEGFTDNGGAIHSAERILNILAMGLKYPELSHMNNYRQHAKAEFSVEAMVAFKRGDKVLIEHVAPVRAFTRKAIEVLEGGASDEEFEEWIKANFRLVLLTPEETERLNRLNRSKMDPDRLASAGIVFATTLYANRE
jgi:hypothetical protein